MKDCCQHVIVIHKRRRKLAPRVTEKDFEVLRQMWAEVEEIGRHNEEIRRRLGLDESVLNRVYR